MSAKFFNHYGLFSASENQMAVRSVKKSSIRSRPIKNEPAGTPCVPRQLPPYPQSLAGRLLAARVAALALIRPILREAQVTEQQWRVLRVLVDLGSIDPSTLASNALLRPPSVTRILHELQVRRLIKREPDPYDARKSIVRISPAGRTLVAETVEATLGVLERYEAAFGVERMNSLVSELALLIETIKQPGDLFED